MKIFTLIFYFESSYVEMLIFAFVLRATVVFFHSATLPLSHSEQRSTKGPSIYDSDEPPEREGERLGAVARVVDVRV